MSMVTKAGELADWLLGAAKQKAADPAVAGHPLTPLAAFALPWAEEEARGFLASAEAEPAIAFGVHLVSHLGQWLADDTDVRDVMRVGADAVAAALGTGGLHAAPPASPPGGPTGPPAVGAP